jgi:hypothetical protein
MRGCPSCAPYGFDPNKDGTLYLIFHDEWNLLKIGIANDLKARLLQHSKIGWQLVDVWGPADGLLISEWEKSILIALKSSGAVFSAQEVAGTRFSGWTEAWLKSTFDISSIRKLMDLVENNEQKLN